MKRLILILISIVITLFALSCFNDDSKSNHIAKSLANLAIENYKCNDGNKLTRVMPSYFLSTFFIKINEDTLGISQLDWIYRYYKSNIKDRRFDIFLDHILFKGEIVSDGEIRKYIFKKVSLSNEVNTYYRDYGFDSFFQKYTSISRDNKREISKALGDEKYGTVVYILTKNGYQVSENDLIGSSRILKWEELLPE